ncbi:LysR family transcriptional regulator [Cryobacterium algoricola]|uniref:LysR family transcriptional regulator n=1 Tax=Cryobacterium algoricola TaxID=1259183 RepID=A0ABY2ID88_9MICO|nr:LysR family transcriptional regulator [Cryobacterium algoricola]TFB87562.1 LysR family transcriptional regulator [Cryobacterium algoricola]
MNENREASSPADVPPGPVARLAPALAQLAALLADTNVTRAAAASGVSQPTLSRTMARWERDLGIVLFSRVGREISLTPDGVALATAATRAATFLESALEDLRSEARPQSLALGFLRSLGPTIVGELVSSFHAQAPGVLVSHREGASSELLDDLEAGRLDIVVVGPRPAARYGWLRLGRQTLSLVVPAHHRLAGLDAVDLADAAEESFLSLDSRYSTRQQADALCHEAGFVPRILLEADDARTVRDYVAGGLGIAILPTDTSVNPRVVNVPIASPNASREIGIAWDLHRRLGPVGASFRDNAEELVARYPGVADLLDS